VPARAGHRRGRGTCPDLSALGALPQPLQTLAGVASRPDEMFAMDRFHPSSAGYRRTAKAVLPSALVAALGYEHELPVGRHGPAVG